MSNPIEELIVAWHAKTCLVGCTIILACTATFSLHQENDRTPLRIVVEKIEKTSPDEISFQLKVANASNRPIFVSGIKYDSAQHIYPLYLEKWKLGQGWIAVVGCPDTPPPDVIELMVGRELPIAPTLRLPVTSMCKPRTVELKGRFRFRLEWFASEEEARTYVTRFFSADWKEARARSVTSEPFEIR